MIFLCMRIGTSRRLVVCAPSFFDARAWAMRAFGCGPGEVNVGPADDMDADVELRWTGSDAGRLAGRRLEVRERGAGGKWTAWRAA